MNFKIGDLVTRNSHNNDLIFKIINIENEIAILKGVNIRLLADSNIDDLKKCEEKETTEENDDEVVERIRDSFNLERSDYFYLPGKVLHIDGDIDYLKRSMRFYKRSNIVAFGIVSKEDKISTIIEQYLIKINPDIVVITGHDAYNRKAGNIKELSSYKNSSNFIKAIREARKYEKAHDKLIIIAGACQSNYEELIKAGANFASSPKRVNIHALDPAIIASSISLSERNSDIDLMGILDKTKYGKDGMGGIKTEGTMYVGYPR
jgi:spore coat assembly protein